ncbi:hypothetical protein ACQEVB_05515 [Pseudonocardia sp. CA-107938]|uniref:hypothetical protein n=1 Tax=Pseudonocardia sp. CA-107938 TaxID=3240021 RepID=UPI003D90143D
MERMSGRLLCYVAPNRKADLAVAVLAAALTGRNPASGLVVRGPQTGELLRDLRRARFVGAAQQPVIVDPGCWTTTVATPDAPLVVAADDDALYPLPLDEQMASWLDSGAAGAFTPSGFVRDGDWPALKAVLAAGAQMSDPRVATLVATEAAMLGPARLETFMAVLDEQRGDRELAFVFAARSTWLAGKGRMAGLRAMLNAFPGSLVVGTEVLAATDVLAHGGGAAIGLLASQRQPRPPETRRGGPRSAGFIPGLFLRELWETRNPSIYRAWYANRAAPVCARCGDRAADSFTTDPADKEAVLLHNVHAWLAVLDELLDDEFVAGQVDQRTWLATQRWNAREAHRDLGTPGKGAPVDPLLDALCDLDGPPQHRLVPTT